MSYLPITLKQTRTPGSLLIASMIDFSWSLSAFMSIDTNRRFTESWFINTAVPWIIPFLFIFRYLCVMAVIESLHSSAISEKFVRASLSKASRILTSTSSILGLAAVSARFG